MKDHKVKIETRCRPYMYTTYYDLSKIKIGDILTLKFGKKPYRVKREYVGKQIKFVVNNSLAYNKYRPTKRLALVPLDRRYTFTKKDVLFLDDADRFEGLMLDLFPSNRRPYAGWRNKTVEIIYHDRGTDDVPPLPLTEEEIAKLAKEFYREFPGPKKETNNERA